MNISFSLATIEDVPALTRLHNAASAALLKRYGPGHWDGEATEKGVACGISNTSKIIVVQLNGIIAGTCRLATKKPWAIDVNYFTPVSRALYLVDMAVAPTLQHNGIGRLLVAEALRVTAEWPAQAIRLDAYDANAGAGQFYSKCGFEERGRVSYRAVPLIYYEWVL